jgi:hypothetical protein
VSSNLFSFIGAWYVLGALLMGSVPLVALATALAGNPVAGVFAGGIIKLESFTLQLRFKYAAVLTARFSLCSCEV